MTLEESLEIKEGDIVLYEGLECMVLQVLFFGSKHPYFVLAGKFELSISKRKKIGKSPISYSICHKK